MRVKFIAPGILPGDYVIANVQTVPRKGDAVLVYSVNATDQALTVKSVVWPLEVGYHSAARDYVVAAAMPEVICDRTDDAPEPEPGCTCHATSLGKPHHFPWCQLETQQPERISSGN